jgi:hypothetical protein
MSLDLPSNNTDVPEAYVGVWRRRSDTDRVYWVQSHRIHASLSIPLKRPDFSGRKGWDDFSDEDLMVLTHQAGVSGACIAKDDIFHPRRQFDYLPRRGETFLRRMRREGSTLYAEALDGTDPCIWDLVAAPEGEIVALRFQDAGVGKDEHDQRRGYLLVVGGHFIFVRDRAVMTQRAANLNVLAECKNYGRQELLDVLDFEISFGRRGGDAPWQVQLSTIPFREGRRIMDDVMLEKILATAGKAPQRLRLGDQIFLRYWSLDEWRRA